MDLAASGGSGLGLALLPIIALGASLVAAAAVGSLVVAWLQKPRDAADLSIVDPETVGLLPVAFVSGSVSNRWLAAVVVDLALQGAITFEDRRPTTTDPDPDPLESARSIRLVYSSDLPSTRAGAPSEVPADLVLGVFEPGSTGTASVVAHGAVVPVDRVVKRNAALQWATRRRFVEAAERYREPRPAARLRLASFAGVLGILLGFLAQFTGQGADDSIAWTALGIAVVSLGVRAVLPRWIPLNASGLELRSRSLLLRERVASADLRDASVARAELPWAVLFGQDEVIARAAESLARRGAELTWYASTEPITPARVASGLRAAAAALVQPITVGGRDDGRFGVPLIDQYRLKTDLGYFGDGRAGGGMIYGDAAGGGGFDGGGMSGFDGGGFDGGGGGGDGGGGGP